MTTYNKVVFGEQTIMDISNDTVTADKVLAGITAHDGSGAAITGTIQSVNATTITPTTSAQTAVPAGKYTNGAITVAAIQTEEKTVTENGVVTPSSGKYLSSVTVNVPTGSTINNQSKTVTPTEERQYTTPDTGYTGLSQVIVEPISSTYVGSGITTRTSTDLTASGATVTVPAGYYSENSSKAVTTAVQATPTISVNTLTGEITATSTQSAGYVAAGTQTATEQLSIQAAATITPNDTSQTAVATNKYTTGAITVAAVPTETKSITTNGTYTPTTGKYFSSVTVNVPTVNISQDANGYIVLDDEGGSGYSDEKYYSLVDGSITRVDDSTITTVRQMAYGHCYNLTYVNLPNCTSISHNSFQNCTALTEIHLPNVTSTGNDTFNSDSALVTLDMPNLVRAGSNALMYCPLTNLHILPKFERFNASIGFRRALFTVMVLPKLNNSVRNTFIECNSLVTADIGPDLANVTDQMFNSNAVLENIILRRTTLVTLNNANGLWGNTSEPAVHKVIYVPSALISSYQTASNWSTLYNAGYITFSAIEGSTYETHYADGTLINAS